MVEIVLIILAVSVAIIVVGGALTLALMPFVFLIWLVDSVRASTGPANESGSSSTGHSQRS